MTLDNHGPTGTRLGRLWRWLAYLAAVLIPVALVVWQDRQGTPDWTSRLGRYSALLAGGILVLQFVLAARWRWVERPFGLDRLLRFHRAMGLVAGLLLVVHPVALAAGDYGWDLLYGLRQTWAVWAGKGAAVALAVLAVTALARAALRLEFQRWLRLHNLVALGVLGAGGVHALATGSDLGAGLLRGWWSAGLAVAALTWVHGAVLRPLLARRRAWTVTAVRAETPTVWTLELEPPAGRPVFAYLPGQFAFLTLRRAPGLPVEEHPFTIASSPTQPGRIVFSIKESGDFTRTIGRTRPGERAAVCGPCGAFSFRRFAAAARRPLVLIAGGIGVTPFLSTLRYLRDTGFDREVRLVWGNRTADDILCRAELEALVNVAGGQLSIVHVLSAPAADWTGERGRVDQALLARVCAPLAGRVYAVCGPPAMRRSVLASLRALGVPRRDLHTETFAF